MKLPYLGLDTIITFLFFLSSTRKLPTWGGGKGFVDAVYRYIPRSEDYRKLLFLSRESSSREESRLRHAREVSRKNEKKKRTKNRIVHDVYSSPRRKKLHCYIFHVLLKYTTHFRKFSNHKIFLEAIFLLRSFFFVFFLKRKRFDIFFFRKVSKVLGRKRRRARRRLTASRKTSGPSTAVAARSSLSRFHRAYHRRRRRHRPYRPRDPRSGCDSSARDCHRSSSVVAPLALHVFQRGGGGEEAHAGGNGAQSRGGVREKKKNTCSMQKHNNRTQQKETW